MCIFVDMWPSRGRPSLEFAWPCAGSVALKAGPSANTAEINRPTNSPEQAVLED